MSFTIKDLESLSGVKAHTIRIWEQRYALLKPSRTDTNIRYYDAEELKNLLNVALLNKYGYRISKITNMTPEQIREKILMLGSTEANLEKIITELIQYMVDFDSNKFEQVLNKYITQKGIERTITQLIFPFLERVGVLWQTNNVIPAQEHLVSNIVRQKLILGIENVVPFTTSKKQILVFSPEGEHHEIGLLYINYLLKNRGVNVLYLGTNVPVDDLPFVIKQKNPDYLYTHLTAFQTNSGYTKFVTKYNNLIDDGVKLILSGSFPQSKLNNLPKNSIFMKSLIEAQHFINKL